MNLAWLEELLPQAMVTPRTKWLWLLFFGLFPLAYVGGWLLERAEEAPARMATYQDRATSIRTAQQFAATKGFSVTGWHQYAIAESRKDLLEYYGDAVDPELAAASEIAPAREVQVLFRSPDQSHEFRVYLSLAGQVTGFDFGKSTERNRNISSDTGIVQIQTTTTHHSDEEPGSMKDAMAPSDMEADSIARKAMSENAALNRLVTLGKADISTDGDDSARREVVWEASPAKRPELKLKVSVSVRDSQVVAQHIEATLDKKHSAKRRYLPIVLETLYGFFLTFGAIYAIYRYAKRTLQKEVSHVRTLVVAALFCISYSVLAYSVAVDQTAVRVSGETFSKIGIVTYVFAVTSFAIMGLLVGIGYGSGEGEVREAFPGKLTSLDALLAGRLLSRDVAASLLFGVAAAGWLLLFHRALSAVITSDIVSTRSGAMTYTFARLPWLTMVLGRQYDSLLVAVTGLLLPAAFLVRSGVGRKRRRFAWLIVFAVFSVMRDAAQYPTFGAEVLATAVYVCALLLPFFAFDLLAAMVSLSALSFVDQLVRLAAVFPSWSGFSERLALVAGMSLAIPMYLAVRGKRVTEEDVRPLYAKNLAERMSLQAEVLAAREAQLRLLPQAAPEVNGVEFAACCLPARGVGGDFYDFFQLDANRVGIFVAQGGDQGLASALCIALAKGVLMHASLQPHTPTQIIVDLERSLGELLEGSSGRGISYAYGVMDTRRNSLSYARLGAWPRFVVHRQDAGLTTAAQLERVVNVAGRAKSAAVLYEGTTHARLGDLLIFFTQGVTSLRARRFGRREFQWVELLMRELKRQDVTTLEASLLSALGRHQPHASSDLTAVVLRVVESQAAAQEVVA